METKWTVVIIFFFSTLLLILLSIFVAAFAKTFRDFLVRCYGRCVRWMHLIHQKYGVLLFIFKHLRKESVSYSIDIIFELFCNFYKLHKEEMHTWGWDVHYFPEGRKTISDLYHWITHVRPQNYLEVENILSKDNHIEYWGVIYNCFRSRINNKGELIITPYDEQGHFVFQRAVMRLHNLLYQLDTEKALWILERRKFFGF